MVRKVLFVCSGNVDRSPTAENLLKGKEGLEVRSAGTWLGAKTAVSKELVSWADVIFVMEEQHKQAVQKIDHTAGEKIVVLGIEDTYLRSDPKLADILREKLSKFFDDI